MSGHLENFKSWYVQVLEGLYRTAMQGLRS